MSRLAAWQWVPAASLPTVHLEALHTELPQTYCSARFATLVSQLKVSLWECRKPCRRSSAMQPFLRSANTYAFRHSPVRLGLRRANFGFGNIGLTCSSAHPAQQLATVQAAAMHATRTLMYLRRAAVGTTSRGARQAAVTPGMTSTCHSDARLTPSTFRDAVCYPALMCGQISARTRTRSHAS